LGQWELAKLVDPIGATVLMELSRVWTPAEKSTVLVGLQGSLLANRVVWITIAVGVLALTHFRVSLAHHVARTWWRRRAAGLEDVPRPVGTTRAAPRVERTFGIVTNLRQTLAVARESLQTIVTSWGAMAAALLALALVVASGTQIEHMGVPLVATSARTVRLLSDRLTNPQELMSLMVPLLVIYFAGELIWREREARLHEIADSAPVPEWVSAVGRFLGLSLALVAAQALMMGAGLLIQVVQGHYDFELGLYARILFGLQLPDYLLFALLALVVHTLVNHKYVGHLVLVCAYAFMALSPAIGIEHRLLVYGSDPGWAYSDIRGFEPFIGPWLWFKFYWSAWALLLGVVGALFWMRGAESALGSRLACARGRLTRPVAGVAATAAFLILSSGGFIFYNTNVLNAYRTAASEVASRAAYEQRYGQYKDVAQPRITGTTLKVEIHPTRRDVEIRGAFQLANLSTGPIGAVHVDTDSAVETRAIRLDRPVREARVDEELGHRIYTLETPLHPGESLQLDFEVRFKPRGFSNRGIDPSVVGNGTYFTNRMWLPAIGYQMDRELGSASDRRAYGLAPRPMAPSLDDVKARQDTGRAVRTSFEAIVGTDEGQVALAPGRLRRTWTEGGRRYFHYVTDAPIGNDYAFFSAAYAVHEGRWNPATRSAPGQETSIEIVHDPKHAWNAERLVRSVQASLDHYTKEFGPYPHGQVRLVEHPGDSVLLHASPINISYEEGFSLLNPDSDPRKIDFPFAVAAHEVAHQWWGHILTPARVEGAALLGESLAWYSALGVVEQTFGREHLARLLGMMRGVYLIPSARANVPLLRADDWFLAYRKGPFAMYALREYVGAERVNGALRRLLEKHGAFESPDRHHAPSKPLATSLDLYHELQAVTPESLHYLLADLFETNTFWDLATQNVTAEQTDTGVWQVTLDMRARKMIVDTTGVETDVPMNDLIEIGVFAGAKGEGPGNALYLTQHRVRSSAQRLTLIVPSRPSRAGIDPRHLLIDVRGDDNLKEIASR
jgi:ABC-2 type transport system permease protein